MLRHLGSRRTYAHNVKLAALLSLTAGFVNAAGYLAFSVLTTNVTGHAALFAERIATNDMASMRMIALWMLLFLSGAFLSSLIINIKGRDERFSYLIPILIEIGILSMVALLGFRYDQSPGSKVFFAGSLLFAMGMQNAMVSLVSGSVVRTTHLTGTFTDLGIELAQLLKPEKADLPGLKSRINLRVVIICCFMSGALAGAYAMKAFSYSAFFAPVVILIYALLYDVFRIRAKRYIRHLTNR